VVFSGNFTKISIFQGKFLEIFDFLGNLTEDFDFPGKNWLFTVSSGQIILFLFKSHHFRTNFLYMIRYNNISRPVHEPPTTPCDPHDPPAQNLGGRDTHNPPGLTPMKCTLWSYV